MKKIMIVLFVLFLVPLGTFTNGECFIDLGETFTVSEGSVFDHSNGVGLLTGTLNVEGTYNLSGDFPTHLYVNNLNISGDFNHTGGGWITGSYGWYYDNFDITVSQTGHYYQSDGILWHSNDSFLNQGMLEIDGGRFATENLINEGTLNYNGASSFYSKVTTNDGVINAKEEIHFQEIRNLDIEQNIVTDINGLPGLILTYNATSTGNAYLNNETYQLSGRGLLTPFKDIATITPDDSFYVTATVAPWTVLVSFDYWFETDAVPGFDIPQNFDVLYLHETDGWTTIGQIDSYYSSGQWHTADFYLPEELKQTKTDMQFRLSVVDFDPETSPVVYVRGFTTVPEPASLTLILIGLFGLTVATRKGLIKRGFLNT